jgi:hypothetical protein
LSLPAGAANGAVNDFLFHAAPEYRPGACRGSLENPSGIKKSEPVHQKRTNRLRQIIAAGAPSSAMRVQTRIG